MPINVRPVAEADFDEWSALYYGYAKFYGVDQTQEMQDKVWTWLHDAASECRGLVAVSQGRLCGLAHYRAFARPLSATIGCFLDDLFVAEDARGGGAAPALLMALQELARSNGWSVIRWITAENNYRGRGLYDKYAAKTNWLTYEIKLS